MPPQRVAIIGAGPAGLAIARQCVYDLDSFVPTVFEQRAEVGGIWNYSEEVGTDKYDLPVPTSMYKDLVANLPKEIMAYPDYPFPKELPSFAHHTEIKKYLESFTDAYDLRKYIKFKRMVTNVKPTTISGNKAWFVTSRDLLTEDLHTDVFDAIFICNGAENLPYFPNIPGMDKFKGELMHSKDYKHPHLYKDKNVIVIGSSFSSCEIVLNLKSTARKIYVPYRETGALNKDNLKGERIYHIDTVKEILANGVLLENGECREVDAIFICTGYRFHLPFLSPECGLEIRNGGRITPLYRHMINIVHPTMMILDVPRHVPRIKISDLQARYGLAYLRGDMKLPSEQEMRRLEEEEYQKGTASLGLPERLAHDMFEIERFDQYTGILTKEANLKPIPDVDRNLWERIVPILMPSGDLPHLKLYTIKVVDGEYYPEYKGDS